MKITKSQWLNIIKLICTAIVSVFATLFAQSSCTTSISVQKHNRQTESTVRQQTSVKGDSIKSNINLRRR